MRISKVWLNALIVSVVLVCFGLSTADAQAVPDLSRWKDTWFSITVKSSGWEIEGEPQIISTSSGSVKGFLNICNLEDSSLGVDLWREYLISGQWVQFSTAFCDYVGGATDLDFICDLNGVIQPEEQPDWDARFETFIRITGKLNTKTQLLKSATLKSSGGFVEGYLDEEFPDTLIAGGITITGTWLNLTTFCKGSNLTTPPCTPH